MNVNASILHSQFSIGIGAFGVPAINHLPLLYILFPKKEIHRT
jgi:hypothetical protein